MENKALPIGEYVSFLTSRTVKEDGSILLKAIPAAYITWLPEPGAELVHGVMRTHNYAEEPCSTDYWSPQVHSKAYIFERTQKYHKLPESYCQLSVEISIPPIPPYNGPENPEDFDYDSFFDSIPNKASDLTALFNAIISKAESLGIALLDDDIWIGDNPLTDDETKNSYIDVVDGGNGFFFAQNDIPDRGATWLI